MPNPTILPYRWGHYNFGGAVRDILSADDLTCLRGEDYGVADVVTRATDQSSDLHKLFYAGFWQMRPTYNRFMEEIARRLWPGQEVYGQQTPTFRVSFPHNMAVGEFHRDRDYNHQQGVVNVWVPLTPAFGTNTIWVESDLGSGLCRPWQVAPGEALVFDGVNWLHGNQRNETRCSRVSFDFRLIPASKYVDTTARSVNVGSKLRLGNYYTKLKL